MIPTRPVELQSSFALVSCPQGQDPDGTFAANPNVLAAPSRWRRGARTLIGESSPDPPFRPRSCPVTASQPRLPGAEAGSGLLSRPGPCLPPGERGREAPPRLPNRSAPTWTKGNCAPKLTATQCYGCIRTLADLYSETTHRHPKSVWLS